MTSRLTEVSIDCAEPEELARFWCAVLDYVVLEVETLDNGDPLVSIGPPGDEGGRPGPLAPTVTFARVPERKTVKNRVHLDVRPSDRDQDAEVRRLLDMGARRIDVGQDAGADDVTWVVLADPEDNEFCVLRGRQP